MFRFNSAVRKLEVCRRNVGSIEQKSNTSVGNKYSRLPANKTNPILTIPAMNPGMSETSYIPQRVVSGAPPLVTMVCSIVLKI